MRTGSRTPARLFAVAIAAAVVLGLSVGVDRGGGVRVTSTPPAHADDFFTSSPGELSKSHIGQDGANGCNECHDGGKEVIQDKCLGCHDHQNLKSRIDAGKGFHAHPSSPVKGKRCESCHLEHKGRGKDIMGWGSITGGEAGFNHDLTGWSLNGKHKTIDCADCHKSRNKQGLKVYLGNDRLCGSCHKDESPHKYDRREMLACERCHGESVWKPAKQVMDFDHNKKADALMPLEGAHVDVTCSKCHPKAVFNLPAAKPDNCGNSGCHTSTHDGHLFGKRECAWCHSPKYKELKKYSFDHDHKTKFDLGASHRKMGCYDCHAKSLGEGKPDPSCEASGCHAKDSKHEDRFDAFGKPLPRCATCHPSSSSTWKPSAFQHDRHTGFELTARHAEIACRRCHRGKTPDDFERFSTSIQCKGCHEHRNVHADMAGDPMYLDNRKKCLFCHEKPGSRQINRQSAIKAVHGPGSRFPLVKAHEGVACEDCHDQKGRDGKPTFKDTPMECGVRCHEDSLHKGKLGDECTRCHAPGIWEATRFQHDEDTKFPLKGMHSQVPTCDSCHPTREFTGTPNNCSADGCHAQDDAHRGRLGDKCEQCHVETGDNIFSHNTMAAFKLEGKHLDVRCADCHPSVTFKPRPRNCFGCHPEPNVHKGQYGTLCEQCHSTRTFTDIRPLHDVGDFALKGGHDFIACNRCHRDNRPLAGSGNLCLNCHRQDDIHSNSLSPRCGECHTQWSFAPARFDHTRVGCNLVGLHRTLPCFDCHKQGAFGATVPTCGACHRDDSARRAAQGNDVNGHAGNQTCAQCHKPNSWLPAASGAGFGRESVCR